MVNQKNIGFYMAVLLLGLAVVPGLIGPAAAQSTALSTSFSPDDSPDLSLARAIQMAADQNFEVMAGRFQVAASKADVTRARSGLLPRVFFTETFNRTTNPMWAFGTRLNQSEIASADFDPEKLNDPDTLNNFSSAIGLTWNVYDGKQTRLGWQQSLENQDVAVLGLKKIRQNAIAKAAIVYVGVLLAEKNQMVIEQALETANAHLKIIKSRFENGFVVKSDLLRGEVRIAELEQELLQAKSRIQVARAWLNAAMGVPIDKQFTATTPLKTCVETPGMIEEWIEKALANRPDLKQMTIQADMAAKEIAKSRAAHLPRLDLMGTYEINSEKFNDSADNYTLGAVLRLNLYSGHRMSATTKMARADQQRVKELQKGLALGIRVQTREAFLTAQSAWQRIAVARSAVAQAGEGLRIVSNRYKNGLLTIVGLLDAEVVDQQVRSRLFKALHDYKVARIRLALASGTIDTDFK
jgi:outer membrane protein TolC